MKYSFIVPVYNNIPYLSACVESVRAAGAVDYEILLIDDGSTDGSGALCDALAERYSEVRVIHQANGGVSAARNRGIREAGGAYILFVDADDLLLPFDETVWQCLDAGEADMLIFGMTFCYYRAGRMVKREDLVIREKRVYTPKELPEAFSGLFRSNYFSSSCNKFIRRTCLADNGVLFDIRLTNYEDLAFSLLAMSKCEKIAVVPEAYYQYRVDYGHDHTVVRVAKIADLMGNTDLIAERFMELERVMAPNGSEVGSLRSCLLDIYFELFGVKMKTTPLNRIRGYCADFAADRYVQRCLSYLPEKKRRMYQWIEQGNAWAIWMHHRYRMIRHFAVRNIKRLLRKG